MKPFLYKFHKKAALLIFFPIFFWVFSGVMHPFMANFFKPQIAHKRYISTPIAANAIQTPLKEALTINNISQFERARIIEINQHYYYQIKHERNNFTYLDAIDGKKMNTDFDQQYATYLGRYFLNDQISAISSIEWITDYTTYYKPINRLLPVYKISFDNASNMDVYVHTGSTRLGTYNNTYRKAFIWFFNTFHNWGFLPEGYFRTILICLFSLIALLTSLAGLTIYGLGFKMFKKQKIRNDYLKQRKNHRIYGLLFSVFCLMFAFSGFYHATKKFTPDDRHLFNDTSITYTENLKSDFKTLISNGKVMAIDVHSIDNKPYYRITEKAKKHQKTVYYDASNGEYLADIDELYAKKLANEFSHQSMDAIANITKVTKFGGEYGFINKRLPVYKITYNTNDNLTYYIETKSGKLAAKINDSDRFEGFSFAFLHKFHFLDALGRTPRDIITILAALSMLLVVFKGWKIRKRKLKRS